MMSNNGLSIRHSLRTILRAVLAVLMTLSLNSLWGEETGFQALAQNQSASRTVKVKGTVVDESSKPVAGVAVLVKGRPELGGTMTDEKGEFAFSVPPNSTVQFSCIGYKLVEKQAGKTLDWLITLPEESVALEGTVVVGYGVQRKESVVGAITQVKAEDLAAKKEEIVRQAIADTTADEAEAA